MILEFYTLMIQESFVDIHLLNKGFFKTDQPYLFSIELSKERALEDWIEEHIMNGKNKRFLECFEDNFKKCNYTKIKIEIEK